MRRISIRLTPQDREALTTLEDAYRRHCGNARATITTVVKVALHKASTLAAQGKLFEVSGL
jgi:hypothetical protein